MKILNSRGVGTAPWGTLALIDFGKEVALP